MRYWWVNQNQTYRAEVRGNFMWSPKANANGARNQFYDNMRFRSHSFAQLSNFSFKSGGTLANTRS